MASSCRLASRSEPFAVSGVLLGPAERPGEDPETGRQHDPEGGAAVPQGLVAEAVIDPGAEQGAEDEGGGEGGVEQAEVGAAAGGESVAMGNG